VSLYQSFVLGIRRRARQRRRISAALQLRPGQVHLADVQHQGAQPDQHRRAHGYLRHHGRSPWLAPQKSMFGLHLSTSNRPPACFREPEAGSTAGRVSPASGRRGVPGLCRCRPTAGSSVWPQ